MREYAISLIVCFALILSLKYSLNVTEFSSSETTEFEQFTEHLRLGIRTQYYENTIKTNQVITEVQPTTENPATTHPATTMGWAKLGLLLRPM